MYIPDKELVFQRAGQDQPDIKNLGSAKKKKTFLPESRAAYWL